MSRIPEPLEMSDAEADEVASTLREIKPEDIDSEWLDDMVHRLFRELKRQLEAVEESAVSKLMNEAPSRHANARTLDTLQRTLERISRMEAERTAKRVARSVKDAEEARASLQRKLDQFLARERALTISEGSEREGSP